MRFARSLKRQDGVDDRAERAVGQARQDVHHEADRQRELLRERRAAPAWRVSWTAAVPPPDAAACTSAVSPRLSPPSTSRLRYAVNQASGIAAASANERRSGIGISIPRGTATLSA